MCAEADTFLENLLIFKKVSASAGCLVFS